MLLFLFLLQGAALPTTSGASISGMIRDEASGAPISGALVILTELRLRGSTDPEGQYRLENVPEGEWRLTVRYIGHEPRTLVVVVPAEGRVELEVSLRGVPVPLPPLDARFADSRRPPGAPDDPGTRRLSLLEIQQDPLLAEPDVLTALARGDAVAAPESPSGLHVRGGGTDQISYLLDGIPVFNPYHTAGQFSSWNPDALSEIGLSASGEPSAGPESLSGAAAAETRTPGARQSVRGGLSTTQARVTLDGPIGPRDWGYLLSLRAAFPGYVAPKKEATYLGGGSGDRLLVLEGPAFRGQLRLLGYQNRNGFNAGSGPLDSMPGAFRRNSFQWQSGSLGLTWQGGIGGRELTLSAWQAGTSAAAAWTPIGGPVQMTSRRRDVGALLAVDRSSTGSRTRFGLRVESSHTLNRVTPESADAASWSLAGHTPAATLFATHTEALGRHLQLGGGASATSAAGRRRLSPWLQLQWRSGPGLVVSGSLSRAHQFAQSLRNAESVVGSVFPAELFVGVGAAGVPVGRSDQALLTAALHPTATTRIGLQAYARRFSGLALVAPRGGEPFATNGFDVGSGSAEGASLDFSLHGAGLALLASYAIQRVRYTAGDSSYVPGPGARQLAQAGVTLSPVASFSIRLGATGAWGRRTTAVTGLTTLESCNLLDQGCEFSGSPTSAGQTLGGTSLPAYLRLDLGIRQEWHIGMGRRDGVVALYGTVTNLLNRENLLTYASAAPGSDPVGITLRPRAPLVVGLDWQF